MRSTSRHGSTRTPDPRKQPGRHRSPSSSYCTSRPFRIEHCRTRACSRKDSWRWSFEPAATVAALLTVDGAVVGRLRSTARSVAAYLAVERTVRKRLRPTAEPVAASFGHAIRRAVLGRLSPFTNVVAAAQRPRAGTAVSRAAATSLAVLARTIAVAAERPVAVETIAGARGLGLAHLATRVAARRITAAAVGAACGAALPRSEVANAVEAYVRRRAAGASGATGCRTRTAISRAGRAAFPRLGGTAQITAYRGLNLKDFASATG